MRFTTGELADATDGEVFGRATEVDGVTIDSRAVQPGQLFVPLIAERDGHDFIGGAIAGGAAAYLTSGPIEAGTAIRVADTGVALTALGRLARGRLADRVVGITGSVGKTSLKDLLRAVGETTYRTAASVGSFNNELGVPLTLANAPADTELTVLEMGARGIGHIAALCEVGRPTVGIVTVVAGAHLEAFGDLDGVARGKSELIAALPADGTAVLNADDIRVAAMAGVTSARVLTFGVHHGEVRAEDVGVGADLRPTFVLNTPWGSTPVHLGIAGVHQVINALGAAAAALAVGVPLEAVAAGLGAASLSARRMHLTELPDGVRVLDDSYNANPTSTAAALAAVAALKADRRFAVLGTMAELGEHADTGHADITAEAARLGVHVIAVDEARYGIAGADSVDGPEQAVARLHELGLGGHDAVLVKASRAAGLERVVDLLHGRPVG